MISVRRASDWISKGNIYANVTPAVRIIESRAELDTRLQDADTITTPQFLTIAHTP